jgi:hypothetical protein
MPADFPEWLSIGNELRFTRTGAHPGRAMVTGIHLRDDGFYVEVTPYTTGPILKGWFPIDWALHNCRSLEAVAPVEEVVNVEEIQTPELLVNIVGLEPFGPLPDWFQIGATFGWREEPYVIEEMWHPLPEMEPLFRIRNLITEEMSVEGGEVLREEGTDLETPYPPEQLNLEPILGQVAMDLVTEIREAFERNQELMRSMGARILQAVREGRRHVEPPPPPAPEEPRVLGPSVWQRLLEK